MARRPRIPKDRQKRLDALVAPHEARERQAIFAVATFGGEGIAKPSPEQLAKLTPAQRGLLRINELAPIPGSDRVPDGGVRTGPVSAGRRRSP